MKRPTPVAIRRQSLRLLVLLALSNTAQAELVEIAWHTDGRFERQLSVTPNGFVELCGKLPAKTKVQWRFDAEAATDFNIHFHAGKVVRYPAKKAAVSSADDTLDVPRDNDYCWMWTNVSTSPIVVKVRLVRLAAR